MAFKIDGCDNVREAFAAANSATITLGGAVTNSRAFSAVLSSGDTFWGAARNGAEFSVGLFTYTSGSPGTIAQTTVFYSTNGNSAVVFSSGTGEVYIDTPSKIMDLLNLVEITVASATTCDIGAVHGSKILISGTTTITSLGTTTNKLRAVRFSGILTLTHHATSLILPGGANITTAAGDTALFMSDASGNFRCYAYTPAGALPANRGGTGNVGGAWTIAAPTVTSTSGTFTSVVANAHYLIEGKKLIYTVLVTITTAGTASGLINITLPGTATATGGAFSGVEAATGFACVASIASGGTTLQISKYDGTTIIASGRFVIVSGTIEIA